MSGTETQGLQSFPEELTGRDAWLDPFDWYREMRNNEPVRYDPDRNSWDVFRYDDVKRVLDDDESFSVEPEQGNDFVEPDSFGEGLLFETMLLRDPLATTSFGPSSRTSSVRGPSRTGSRGSARSLVTS